MTEEIVRLAADLGAEETEGLRALCAQAETELAARLRDGVTPQDCAPAFLLGCAWTALADLQAGQGRDGFTAGGLTIRPGGDDGALRQRAEAVLAPYLRDRGFGFAGVRG